MTSSTEERELGFTPAYILAEMIKSKKLSPVELMAVTLKRIKELNPKLNAYLTVADEEAMQAAQQAEKALVNGANPGLLYGIPIPIKDLYLTKGIRTTFGSLVYKDFTPDADEPMVQRLKAAGAIVVGKTNTPEFGMAVLTENKLGDACRNPWNTEMNTGGSSGGAAASVAAGITSLAQSSDGGGSTRIPACFCGVFGLKGSFGRVPKRIDPWGVSHLACLDTTARTVRDAALMLNAMAGPDGLDYTCIKTRPPDFLKALDGRTEKLKVAFSPDLGYDVKVNPEVKSTFEAAVRIFEELGHEVEEAAPAIEAPFALWDMVAGVWSYVSHDNFLEEHADEVMDYTKHAIVLGGSLNGTDVVKSWIQVEKIRGTMTAFFQKYDLLLTPTTAVTAPPVGKRGRDLGHHYMDWEFTPFTPVFNFSSNPVGTIPCGFSSNGLPIGLQIAGGLEDEVTVLRASAAFEEARPWTNKRPSVS